MTRRSLLRMAPVLLALAGILERSALARAEAQEPDTTFQTFRALCRQTARANVVAEGLVIPSAAYAQACWMRDAFWTLAALEDWGLAHQVWRRFAAAQLPSGQVPTSIARDTGAPYQEYADESSMFFVLLAVCLKGNGRTVESEPLHRAASYLLSRVDDQGRFITSAGPWGWWLDTYVLLAPTTVAYCQGLLCASLLGLWQLGITTRREVLDAALDAYQQAYNPDAGAITLSRATTDLDVSCLVGEYLCGQMFARSVLPPAAVTNTLDRFSRVHHEDGELLGFKVATQQDGSYVPNELFAEAPDNFPGHYHNAGSWLLYDAIALAAAHRHGHPAARELLAQRVRSETRRQSALHEYLVTEPGSPSFGTAPFDFRLGYGWNSYVARILDEVGL